MQETAPDHIATIERVTLAAVPPQQLISLPDFPEWLIPLDHGTVGRTKSAVPLTHTAPDLAVIDAMEAAYESAALPCAWRLPNTTAYAPMCDALTARSYRAHQPTAVQIANVNDMVSPTQGVLNTHDAWQVRIFDYPDMLWQRVFLGEGFDATDGASRIQILSRSRVTQYGVIVDAGNPVASGALSISHGWASLHGMRTVAPMRGRGLASALIRAFARHAKAVGITRCFLQVDAENAAACRLYRAFGFQEAWRYQYWRR